MKRYFSLLLAAVCIFSAVALSGCSSDKGGKDNASSQTADKDNEATTANAYADKGEVADGLDVSVETYSYDDYSNGVDLFVTNKTGKPVQVRATVDYSDENGELIGSQEDDRIDVADGSTICLYALRINEKFADFKYKVTWDDTFTSHSVDQDLSMEIEKQSDRVVVNITNNGKLPASNVLYNAIFYKNGEIVYQDSGACEDDDSEIKPGKTCRSEKEFDGDLDKGFDDVKVYFHGLASPEYFG